MKKTSFMFAMLLFAITCVFGIPISMETAELVARNFALERLGTSYTVSTSQPLDSRFGNSYMYVVHLKPQGFVIIASDDASMPVLGYSTMNKWNEYEVPEQLKDLLSSWNEQLHYIRTQRLSADIPISITWSKYNRSEESFTPNYGYRNVSPLITSTWGQGTYYNAQCPSGTPVGCVATAMAQIMRYWAYPTVGQGSHSYNCPPYGTQTADFGNTTYNWAAMPNAVNSANTAVATISRHAGVAVDMQYAPDGSGAYSTDVPDALINYFKYKSTTQYRSKSSYSNENWDTLLRGELDNARPVYYSGSSTGSGGHAFIFDGYQGSYPSTQYHVNWGWYGYYNGYYSVSALNPGTDNFTSYQAAVTGIEPSGSVTNLTEDFEIATFPPPNWSRSATSWTRQTTSAISGEASARYNGSANNVKLITPKLTIDASSTLSFKAKRGSVNRSEIINIQYSTNGTSWTSYYTTTALGSTAATYNVSFSSLTPGDYYLAFNANSSNSNSQTKTIFVDDVAGPALWVDPNPTVALNLTAWAAGSVAPGEAMASGPIFMLSNLTGGTLQITGVTNLSGTEFSSTLNPGVQLVTGQIHEFGFTYEPLNYGTDIVTYTINTNGGTVSITLTGEASSNLFSDGFESYNDFSISFPPWTQHDGDLSNTYSIEGYTYANQGYTGSFMVFNASQTSPSLLATAADTYAGSKGAYCFAAVTYPNNDWLISPQFNLVGPTCTVSFWAKSYTSTYGLERFKVLYSTTTNAVASFTNYLAGSSSSYISAPVDWTYYSYTLPVSAKYVAIQCVSSDAFIFMLDNFIVTDNGQVPPVPSYGNLSGYVYEYGTTNPILGALVQVGSKTAYTNPSGYYQINNLVVGTYSATCSTPGMFYHTATTGGIAITTGNTTTQNFSLKWGELVASPTSISVSLYQGETGNSSITLSNPGGTANTSYAGFITSGSAPASLASQTRNGRNERLDIPLVKPDLMPIQQSRTSQNESSQDRLTGWFGYGNEATATYVISNNIVERGDYFAIDDIGLMDGDLTVSQLRHYFYNPATTPWTSTTNKFKWKVYTVSPEGTVALVHTSAEITLPTTTPTNTTLLSTYTIPTPLTIPAGYDFIVTVLTTSTTGVPHSLITDVTYNNGIYLDGTTWTWLGYDAVMEAYVTGTSWLDGTSFSGTIAPTESVSIPLNFNTVGVTAGTKYANMYVYNDSNYISPSPRGDVMVIPVSLTVIAATQPVAVITTGTNWETFASVGSPSSSGNVFTLKNVGPGNLTITSISGLTGTPFTTNFNTSTVLPQNATYDFGFTFSPTETGIYTATFTIETNGGTKTITLKGYGNYIYESFEGATFPPDGWQSVDVDGDTYNWFQYNATGSAHTGTYCAASASWVSDSRSGYADSRKGNSSRLILYPNNYLITPRLLVPADGVLEYWIAAQDPAWPAEHYSVMISTTNNAVASFATTLFNETLTNGTWQSREIDLSAYAGQNVFIAFVHHNCSNQFYLKLDDIIMPPLAAPLVYGNITGRVRKAGTDENIEAALVSIAGRNFTTLADGAYTFNNVVVDTYPITVSATGYVNYSADVTIPENATLTHNVYLDYAQFSTTATTFNMTVTQGQTTSTTLNLSNIGTAAVNWTADSGIWGGDSFPSGPFLEDFEDMDINGWVGSVGANSDIYTGYGYNSQRVWVFSSYGTTSPQWIATPRIRVQAGDNLSFWYKQFNNSSETFSVLISTTTNEASAFTNTLATVGPLADTNWAQFNQSLAAYAGQDIYIAFNYPRIDGDQYGYILLDDIAGGTGVLPPTEWLSSTASGTLGAGGSTPFTLYANAAGRNLPVGNYTAQTWIFGTATNSPYKLNVNLTVTEPITTIDPPENPVSEIVLSPSGELEVFAMAADVVANANSYKLYGCDTPNGTFVLLQTSTDPYFEVDNATLALHGLSDRAFFRITADTATRNTPVTSVLSKTSSPLLQNYIKTNNKKTLNVLK